MLYTSAPTIQPLGCVQAATGASSRTGSIPPAGNRAHIGLRERQYGNGLAFRGNKLDLKRCATVVAMDDGPHIAPFQPAFLNIVRQNDHIQLGVGQIHRPTPTFDGMLVPVVDAAVRLC